MGRLELTASSLELSSCSSLLHWGNTQFTADYYMLEVYVLGQMHTHLQRSTRDFCDKLTPETGQPALDYLPA